MKNVVLAIAAILMLIALPVAALAAEPTTTTTAPGTTAPTEERTNAVTPMHSSDPGLTATGTVVSWNDQEVVINTSTGPTHVKILPATLGMRTFTVGQSVSVDFTRNEQGVLLAKQIRASGAPEAQVEVAPATEPAESVATEAKENIDGAAMSAKSSLNPPVTTPPAPEAPAPETKANLPATASNSPLLALLGLLALGGAVALRRR